LNSYGFFLKQVPGISRVKTDTLGSFFNRGLRRNGVEITPEHLGMYCEVQWEDKSPEVGIILEVGEAREAVVVALKPKPSSVSCIVRIDPRIIEVIPQSAFNAIGLP
jgi:hypothetical protein